MDKAQAYQSLWGRFGIPAYNELSVPDGAKTPYITYQTIYDSCDESVYPTASLWYKDTSWLKIDAKLKEISKEISEMDDIPLDEGFMSVDTNNPFAQPLEDDENRDMKRYVLSVRVEFLTNY